MMALATLSKDPAFRHEARRAMLKGLGFVAILIVMLTGWTLLRADDARARWEENFPSKTVVIQSPVTQGLSEADRVTPQDSAPAPAAENADDTPAIATAAPEESLFNQFRKTAPLAAGKTHIAIVMTDLGIARGMTGDLLDTLPAGITLGFSPYAPSLDDLKKTADTKGFESWLMLPLEPQDYPTEDPGPMTVLTNAPLDVTQDTVNRLTALAAKGYPGFISNADHIFADTDLRTNPLMRMIAEKGFGYAEGRSEGGVFAKDFAGKNYIPYAQASEWLKRDMGRADIEATLQRIEKLSQLNGSVVLMIEPTPVSTQLLREWLDKLPGLNMQLVPLSALAQ